MATQTDTSSVINTNRFPVINTINTPSDENDLRTRLSTAESIWVAIKNEARELCTFHPKEWLDGLKPNKHYPLFTRGDIDGFVALFINNLATLLAVIGNLLPILGNDIVYGRIVPGVGIAMFWGNIYYVYMARKLARKENRNDVCAQPYGINTPGAFAFVFSIIFPTYHGCAQINSAAYCRELAWYVALASNFITGCILLLLCVVGEHIRRHTPAVALLSSISGIGFTYLALNEYIDVADVPIVAFIPFAIVMLGYFGNIKFGPIPVAFVALVAGTALGWATGTNTRQPVIDASHLVKGYAPVFPIGEMFRNMKHIGPYLSTTIPTAISIAIGTIQCVESAKRAGDFYPTRESMLADGVGTLIASIFGSILGMTAFIGHPAFKKMGARQGYSLLNAFAFLPLCFLGLIALLLSIIAIVSINPIIIFIGLVICSDTLAITPRRHYPAFLLGLMPVVADWAKGTIISGVTSSYESTTNMTFSDSILDSIKGYRYHGLVNFGGGALLNCIFIAAILMYIIDRKFVRATVWSLLAAVFSFFGLINANSVGLLYRKTDYGWKFTVAYTMLAVLFCTFELLQRWRWVDQPEEEPDDLSSLEWAEWNRRELLRQQEGPSIDKDTRMDQINLSTNGRSRV